MNSQPQSAFDPDESGSIDEDVAYTEGWESAEIMRNASCPYQPGTPQHDRWFEGYEDFLEDLE